MPTILGLYWYEVVLLVLGVLLFIVLLIALRRNLAQGKSPGNLIVYFLLSIVMMGYPSITSIRFEDDGMEIDKEVDAALQNPSDPQSQALIAGIQTKLNRFAPRAVSPQDRAIVEKAERAVRLVKASRKGLTGESNQSEVLARVDSLANELKAKPGNTQLRNELEDAVRQLKASGASPAEEAAIKRADEALAAH